MIPAPEPDPASPTWPFVLQFAKHMEAKLAKNRHKGDRSGWLKDHSKVLFERLLDETDELRDELTFSCGTVESITSECADVANFAMMTADRVSMTGQNPEPFKE